MEKGQTHQVIVRSVGCSFVQVKGVPQLHRVVLTGGGKARRQGSTEREWAGHGAGVPGSVRLP